MTFWESEEEKKVFKLILPIAIAIITIGIVAEIFL
jgi:hypothetical protein